MGSDTMGFAEVEVYEALSGVEGNCKEDLDRLFLILGDTGLCGQLREVSKGEDLAEEVFEDEASSCLFLVSIHTWFSAVDTSSISVTGDLSTSVFNAETVF